MDPLSLGLGLGVAAISTGIGISNAKQQNKAQKKTTENAAKAGEKAKVANAKEAEVAIQSSDRATALQIGQLRQQTELERNRAANEIERVRGNVRVAQADSGLGMGGSALALERQLQIDAAINDEIGRQNLANNIIRVQQGLAAETAQTQARLSSVFASIDAQTQTNPSYQSPFLAALGGGIQGLGTGLAIAGATQSIFGKGGAA